MTVRGRKTARNNKIRRMLLEAYPVSMIARLENISQTRVRQIRDAFIATGELIAIPHTKPIIYSDPRAYAVGTEFSDNGGGAETNGGIRDSLPPSGRLPLGMVNAHIKGRISMTVRKKGSFSNIRGTDGLYVGYWDKATPGGKGKIHRKGHLMLFKQELTVNYYESSKGTTEFYVNPGRVYYYPSKAKRQDVLDYMIERALYIVRILRNSGWEITDPQLPKNYQLHRGKENDPLAFLIPPRYHDEGQDIVSDTSPNYLETELEDASDEELVEIYADMPSAIAEAKREGLAAREDIERMKQELVGLKEVVDLQTGVIKGLAGNVTLLSETMVKFLTVEASSMKRSFGLFTGEGYL